MTDKTMPDILGVCGFVDGTYEAYTFTTPPATPYHHDDKYQAVVKGLDEANSLLGDMSVFLDNLLADISLGYEHVAIDWEKYAEEKKAKIEQHLNRSKEYK